MEDRIFALEAVLEVIKLPDNSAKSDSILRGLVEGDESRALTAGTPRHQQMERER